MSLVARKRHTREETRARIMDEADVLFRQLGFSKTTVADIARELKMSTANIYKFFSSKNALVEACADRRLGKIQIDLRREAGAKKSAADRLLGIILLIYRVHREDFRHERQIHRLVLAATEENWACIRSFKKTLAELVTSVLEDGMKREEFRRTNAAATTQVLLDCFTWITNPLLFHELAPGDVKGRARAQLHFLRRALK